MPDIRTRELSLTIDGRPRSVAIVDGALEPAVLGPLDKLLRSARFSRTEYDSEVTRDRRQWVLELPRFEEQMGPVWSVVRRLGARARLWDDDAALRILRAYCNAVHFGDQLYVHRDCDPDDDHLTALIYANARWERDWGGETLFFDEHDEAVAVVAPRPGRIALFHGSIPHRAGAPMRDCHESRYTIALKIAAA